MYLKEKYLPSLCKNKYTLNLNLGRYLAFFQDFFQGGAAKSFFGGAPSKFSGTNDSGGGANFFKENEIFTSES